MSNQETTKTPETTQNPLLMVKDLSKSFWLDRKRIDVLRGASMSINESETCAIVGVSGAGKSTLLHILGTLDTPTTGQFVIDGQDVLTLTEEELAGFRNRTIGFVFQAHYLLPEFTALENIMMPAFIRRIPRKEAQARAKELMEWVGLAHRMEHRPGELSGGERQRVALCRALVMKPRILLADEPTGNLDSNTADGIHALILSLKDQWRVTPIVVTHNLSLAAKMERCFHLIDGQLQERPASTGQTNQVSESNEVNREPHAS